MIKYNNEKKKAALLEMTPSSNPNALRAETIKTKKTKKNKNKKTKTKENHNNSISRYYQKRLN
jgi:hypothetical protein